MPTDYDISQADPVSSIPVGAKVLYFSTETGWGCVLAEDLVVSEVAIANVTGLQAALDAKASTSHTQAISTVTGLQAALDAKASTTHTQAISTVTGLQAALDAKASTSHTHSIANVTGLQAVLDAKVGYAGNDSTNPTGQSVAGRIEVSVGGVPIGYLAVYSPPPNPPGPPTSLDLTPWTGSPTDVLVSWGFSTTGGPVTGYKIYINGTHFGDFSSATSSWAVDPIVDGDVVGVTAFNPSGESSMVSETYHP
jgi:hypothetical protein